jgi:signal transduction histidine kinase
MTLLSSLRSRIFLASALLTVLCIGVAIYLVNVRVTEEAERTLEREMVSTAALVDNLRTTRTETFTQMARIISDAPTLKAAVDTNHPPTVQDIADGYQHQLKSNLLLVTNRTGHVLATVGASPRTAEIISNQPAVRDALAGRESLSLLPQPDGMLQLVTVPIFIGLTQPEILGTLSIGFMLDNALAAQLKQITLSDVAFGMDGQVLAATLPREFYPALAERLRTAGTSRIQLGAEEYAALPRPLAGTNDPGPVGSGPVALILRSRTEQLQSLRSIHTGLFVTAIVAVLLATVLSFAVARTIAQPLAAITDVMREVASTGDLTRKIALGHRNRWDDEDARLLATTFNTLTDSIARFQREISQKERLTSLGRLSTVIAHEIRNPLMIIKSALHTLRQQEVSQASIHEAVADIDEEVVRLNRIVNEVLDFARPIRFELSTVDLNALCRESAAAALASGPGADIELHLDPAVSQVTTDPERLRIALVNMLVNARHAVNGESPEVARAGSSSPPAPVALTTTVNANRVRITIADRGVGIAGPDLAHVFDPYFTTKRGGTGLGLPIAKNIVEGLSGTMSVSSTPGRGTEMQIVLPFDSRAESPLAQGRPTGSRTDCALPPGRPADSRTDSEPVERRPVAAFPAKRQ